MMFVKRYILFIILTICTLSALAQSKLTFDTSEWNFGTIRETDGKVSHTFTARNDGSQPVVIIEVTSTCGCTVPEFSKKPILPGQQTQVKVIFDPTNRPGTFVKDLSIFDSDRKKIGTLILRGTVIERTKTVEELYPVELAGGLRLTTNACAFSYVYLGRRHFTSIGYANVSDRKVTLSWLPQQSSGFLTIDGSQEIAAGARGELQLSYFVPTTAAYYGTLEDVLTLRVNGRPVEYQLIIHGIAVDNPEHTTNDKSPQVQVEKNSVKFGVVKRGAPVQKQTFLLSNRGTAVLHIRAVEIRGAVGCSLKAGMHLAAGKTLRVELTLDPAQQVDYGAMSAHISIITDDPVRPMRKLRVTAIVEE
ncbi:MAG: DUF1573 domain-containing protein [Alistipes sp.]